MSASDTGRRNTLPSIERQSRSPIPAEEVEERGRTERIRLLKAQIKAGTYRADIKDIAMQLAAAMDPLT